MKGHMKAPRRCGYCFHLIVGDPYLDAGVEYCSASCQKLGMHRRVMRAQSPWHIVLAILATLLTMAATSYFSPAKAHDPYTKWQRSDGKGSCCYGRKVTDGVETGDCAPAASRYDGKSWWAKHDGYWIKVPDDKIIRERNPMPEQGHLCINGTGEVLCYVPPQQGS